MRVRLDLFLDDELYKHAGFVQRGMPTCYFTMKGGLHNCVDGLMSDLHMERPELFADPECPFCKKQSEAGKSEAR